MLRGMKRKGKYNVLAVYSLTCSAGREHFSGVLDEMAAGLAEARRRQAPARTIAS